MSIIKKFSKRKKIAKNDYVVYLQDGDLILELIKIQLHFRKLTTMLSYKWINVMKEELKSMEQDKVWIFSGCQKVLNQLGVSVSLRPSAP